MTPARASQDLTRAVKQWALDGGAAWKRGDGTGQ